MRIDLGLPLLSGAEELIQQAAQGVRVLAGELPELPASEPVPAHILQTTSTQTLVQIKGSRVVLEALPGFLPGEEVQVRLATSTPEPLLQVLPRPQPRADLSRLRVGQETTVQVLEELPGGSVLLGIQGTEVEATLPEAMPRTERFTAVVEQTGPELVLRVLDAPQGEAQARQILREHLPDKQPLGQVMQELQGLLAETDQENQPPTAGRLREALREILGPERPPTPERVARVVRDGGLQYEAKLAQSVPKGRSAFRQIAATDLKGLVMQTLHEVEARPQVRMGELRRPSEALPLAQAVSQAAAAAAEEPAQSPPLPEAATVGPPQVALAPPATPEPPGLAQTLLFQLNQIETQQAINLLAQAQGGPLHFQIPLTDGPQLTTVALAVERDPQSPEGRADGRSRGHSLYFHLDLQQLGPLRIDAHITPHTLRAIFYTDKQATQQLMQSDLATFRDALQAGGYAEVLLAVRPSQLMNSARRAKFEGLARGVPERLSLLDVRI